MKKLTEYDVTFAVKEWLLAHKWSVIAFNPPGAQGTFSIPDPAKDPKYKGQTGTVAPDIIAVKTNHVLIVECKDFEAPKVLSDVEKILKLILNEDRMEILYELVTKMCRANNIETDSNFHTIVAVGYGGKLLLTEITQRTKDVKKALESIDDRQIQSFYIEITDPNRDTESMNANIDPASSINATLFTTDCEIKDILLCSKTNDQLSKSY